MSALSLACFLANTSKVNKKVPKLLHTVVKEVELNEYLYDQCQTVQNRHILLKIDLYNLENILEKLKDIQKIRISNNTDAEAAFLSTLKTRLLFEKFHLEKLMQFELKNMELRINCEFEELQQLKKQNDDMYQNMNERQIVQDLREQQLIRIQQKEETETMQQSFVKESADLFNQTAIVQKERNCVVLVLIDLVKQFQNIQKQPATTKQEESLLLPYVQLLENEHKDVPVPSSVSFVFLDKIKNEIAKFPFLLDQVVRKSVNNQLVQSYELQNTTMVRSILRKKPVDDAINHVDITKKRVLLVAASDFSQSGEENVSANVENTGHQDSFPGSANINNMNQAYKSENKGDNNIVSSPLPNAAVIDLVTPLTHPCSIPKNKEIRNYNPAISCDEEIRHLKINENILIKDRKISKTRKGDDQELVWEVSSSKSLCDGPNHTLEEHSKQHIYDLNEEPSTSFKDISFHFNLVPKNKKKVKKLSNKTETLDDLLKFTIDLDDKTDENSDSNMEKIDFINFFD